MGFAEEGGWADAAGTDEEAGQYSRRYRVFFTAGCVVLVHIRACHSKGFWAKEGADHDFIEPGGGKNDEACEVNFGDK